MQQAEHDLEPLRYPVGRFAWQSGQPTAAQRAERIQTVAQLPSRLRAAVTGLTDAQIDTPYRPGGWTVRQLVHHVADSHTNAYVRIKLALTEDAPAIKGYDEKLWAELPDSALPIEIPLAMLDAIHARWHALWESMDDAAFARVWLHPEHGSRDLDYLLQLYAWHSRHHVAHVTALREREGW